MVNSFLKSKNSLFKLYIYIFKLKLTIKEIKTNFFIQKKKKKEQNSMLTT